MGFTPAEVASFLQYDLEAVHYWLRTGHLLGQRGADGSWRIQPADLVAFLRQSNEPMPTGVAGDPAPVRLEPVRPIADAVAAGGD